MVAFVAEMTARFALAVFLVPSVIESSGSAFGSRLLAESSGGRPVDCQHIDGEILCLAVKVELEAFGEVVLQHSDPKRFVHLDFSVGLKRQIEFVGPDPVWSTDDLHGMKPVGERDEIE